MGFWDRQQSSASANMMDAAVERGMDFTDRWNEKRMAKQIDIEVRTAYLNALEAAKETGEMPERFQASVPCDWVGIQVGIKAVAIRELGKLSPAHPMVLSKQARESIGKLTLIAYNKANRPSDKSFDDFVPSDNLAQAVFQKYPK